MWAIAGGILLAVLVLFFWPVILGVGLVVLALAAIGIGVFLIFGTESGQAFGIIVVAIVATGGVLLICIRFFVLAWDKTLIVGQTIREVGGFDLWVGNKFLALRPALTDAQKVKKSADLILRRSYTAQIKEQREAKQNRRKRENEERARLKIDRQRTDQEKKDRKLTAVERERLKDGCRKLESKFSKYRCFEFRYVPNSVLIFSGSKMLLALRCDARNGNVQFLLNSDFSFQDGHWQSIDGARMFSSRRKLIGAARETLRDAATEELVRQKSM